MICRLEMTYSYTLPNGDIKLSGFSYRFEFVELVVKGKITYLYEDDLITKLVEIGAVKFDGINNFFFHHDNNDFVVEFTHKGYYTGLMHNIDFSSILSYKEKLGGFGIPNTYLYT